jgi:predicted Zn-dependent peptidase
MEQAPLHLESGLRVVVRPDHRVPLVALHLCCLAGARHDAPDRSGLAHLAEHLAFAGPQGGGEPSFPRRVRQCGGLASASTFHDRTAYSATLPAHRLDLGLWIESERLSERIATFADEALEVERRVLLQERRQRVDNPPYGRSFEVLHQLLYPPDHPYHQLPGGRPEDLQAITRADVEAYLRQRYSAANAVLSLAGDVEMAEAERQIERYLGSRTVPRPVAAPPPGLPPLAEARQECLADRVPLPRVYLAFRGPGYGHRLWYAAALLVRCLAVGRASRLQRQLIFETALAQDVSSHTVPMREASTMVLAATSTPGVEARRLAAALTEAVDEVLREGLDQPALERARKKALTDHYWAFQRLGRRAERLASMTAFFGEPRRCAEGELYAEVTPADVMDYAHRCCQPENRVLLSILPRGGKG